MLFNDFPITCPAHPMCTSACAWLEMAAKAEQISPGPASRWEVVTVPVVCCILYKNTVFIQYMHCINCNMV